MHEEVEEPTFLGIAVNRIVAFGGPYLAVLAGTAATWLTSHVHLFATFHVGDSDVANAIAQTAVFGFTTIVVWLGQHKWLDGFQKWAYGVVTQIEHTPLPDSYQQRPPAVEDRVQGFDDDVSGGTVSG